jgi:hypothetical protein
MEDWQFPQSNISTLIHPISAAQAPASRKCPIVESRVRQGELVVCPNQWRSKDARHRGKRFGLSLKLLTIETGQFHSST